MDWLQFVASMVDSLAWPAAALAIVTILRKPLRDLLPLLQKLKYKDLELEFGRRLLEVQAEVTAQLPAQTERAIGEIEDSVAVRLAPVSPRAAILEAWRGVESAILEAAHSLGKPFFDDRSPVLVSAIRALEESGQLLRAQADILDDLRQLRNEAAHAPEFSIPVSDALDYVRLSEVAASHLRGIAAEAPRR